MKDGNNTNFGSFFDLHTHTLPAIDDGAPSSEESLGMLRAAISQGVGCLAMTSHCSIHSEDGVERFLNMRRPCLDRLLVRCAEHGLSLPLLVGAEVYADHDITKHQGLEQLCYTPVGGTGAPELKNKCLLFELPSESDRDVAQRSVYTLNSRGIKVIMAHIERYRDADEVMSALNGMDVYFQINADSVLSFGGKRLLDRMIMRSGRIIVSSDMHGVSRRPNRLGKAYAAVEKRFGTAVSSALFFGNARNALGVDPGFLK
jgi:protein-tyrosine phosphatase